jgi:hypothetical protein
MPDVFDAVTTPITQAERGKGHVTNVVHAEPNGNDLYMVRPEEDWGTRFASLHSPKVKMDTFFSIAVHDGKPTVLDGPQPEYDAAVAQRAVRACVAR